MKLVIAEKRSVANTLLEALQTKEKFKNGKGYFQGEKHIITWAYGHLLRSKTPSEYDSFSGWNWDSIPLYPPRGRLDYMVPNKTDFDRNFRSKQLKTIKDLYQKNKINLVINACDPEREGELIFWEIYEYLKMKSPVKRLWLQTSEVSDAILAFDHLREPDFFNPRKDAAYARQYADWLLGNNLTVAFTVKAGSLLHIGRVQTPTLSLLVNRKEQIENFKSEEYFELDVEFGNKYYGKWYKNKKGNTKINNESDIDKLIKKIENHTAIVTELEVKSQKQRPKLLFDLSDLQKEAVSKYGYTAQKTLDIAQELYDRYKVLSYPRTDSNYLTESQVQSFEEILNSLSIPDYKDFTEDILAMGIPTNKNFVNDKKVSDHYAIIPTRKKVNWNEFDDNPGKSITKMDLKNIYDMVAKRFLSVFYPSAEYEKTDVVTEVDGETFKTSGRVLIEEGWRKVYGEELNKEEENKKTEDDQDVQLPSIKKNEENPVTKREKLKKHTKPPAHYNEGTLISAMERARDFLEEEELKSELKEAGTGMELGTVATRASIIENLISRKYVERKGKRLIATELANKLIQIAPDNLRSPEVTALWESKLKRMEKNDFDREVFYQEIRDFVSKEIIELKNKEINVEFENTAKRKSISKCPKCEGDVIDYGRGVMCTSSTEEKACLKLWKTIAKKKLSNKIMIELIEKGETGVLGGFKSKTNTPFRAKIRLKEDLNGIEFIFPEPEKILDCPKCEKPITKKSTFYSCESNSKENPCTIGPLKYAKKTLTNENIKDLVLKKETKYLRFKSKQKTTYEAKLVMKNEKIEMKFKSISVKCPECDGEINEVGKTYRCNNNECKFLVFAEMSQKEITEQIIKEVLERKQSVGPYEGFISKGGKPFKAKLKYDREKKRIVFDF